MAAVAVVTAFSAVANCFFFVLVDGDVTPEVQRRGQRSGGKREAGITG